LVELKYTIEALKSPVFNGVSYKRVKKFKQLKKAESYADTLPLRSKRFPPVVEQQKIGWRFGYRYNVCIPKQ